MLVAQTALLVSLIFSKPPDLQILVKGGPKVGSVKFKEQRKEAIVRLIYENDFRCTGAVVDASYAVTAAHCVVDGSGMGLRSGLSVTTESDPTDVPVKLVGLVHRLDYALVEGDFSSFKSYKINHKKLGLETVQSQLVNTSYPSLIKYKSCGYPMGAKTQNCVTFVPLASWGFQIIGDGQLFPGMSGGPVVDSNNILVGVNSAVYADKSIISPIIGIFSAFGVE